MTARLFFSVAMMSVGFVGLAHPVEAKIICQDGFQQQKAGNWISTPYCNDEHLAQIGRRHGFQVSGAQLRADYGKKAELCRLVGSTTSARSYCPDESPEGRGK